MRGSYLTEAWVFLITTLFGLYITLVLLRFLLQCVRADFYNPVSQFLVKATNPLIRRLRRWIPGYAGIDWPTLVLLLALQVLELLLVGLAGGALPSLPILLVLAIANLLKLCLYIYYVAIIVQVIISWINPGAYNPITVLLYQLTRPLLRPAQRLIPPLGGLDFSPVAVLIALRLVDILVISPLTDLGLGLARHAL